MTEFKELQIIGFKGEPPQLYLSINDLELKVETTPPKIKDVLDKIRAKRGLVPGWAEYDEASGFISGLELRFNSRVTESFIFDVVPNQDTADDTPQKQRTARQGKTKKTFKKAGLGAK